MTPKHTPATPLPWYSRPSAGDQQHMVSSEKTGETVAVFYRAKKDAAYAAHAAEHYPKLVRLLKTYAGCDLNEGNCASLEVATKRIRFLAREALRDIGES